MTNKNSFKVILMQVFETTMRKNPSRKDYSIGIKKSENVDESKFTDNKCQVIVMFKEDYDITIQHQADKEAQIRQLNKRIIQLEDEIAQKSSVNKSSTRELYAKIDELKKEKTNLEKKHEKNLSAIHQDHKKEIEAIQNQYNAQIDELNIELSAKGDEIQDLKLQYEREISDLKQSLLKTHHDDLSAITSEREKVIDSLRDEKAALLQKQADEIQDLQKSHHLEVSDITSEKQKIIDKLKNEISDMKLQHQADISHLISKYKDTLITLRTKDNNEIASYNKKLFRIKDDLKDLGFFAKHTSSYVSLLNELDEAIDEFETNNKNKLLSIDEDFAKIPSNAVNENNENSE